ncbi:transporter substrate-binding domain-containing protein [Terrilactibacillus sp. S3-3]|nr:transporter substrate-binding domain-containing protein [Terrilactibacillus sp. S3-3]
MKKASLLLIALLLVVLSCGASSSSGENGKKTIVMGTSADYPPFESVDTQHGNKIVGFDIDMAKYIANKLGYNLQIKNQDFDGLIPALNSKRIDFVMAGMVDTPAREKQVDFSKTYYNSYQVVLARKGENIKTLNDLKGKKVGVQLGTTQETLATQLNKRLPMTLQKWDKLNEMVEALRMKRVDAVITVDTVAYGYTNKYKDLNQFNIKATGPAKGLSTSDPISVAFPKNSKLTAKFNKVLDQMDKNGEKQKLVNKWIKSQK